MALHGGGVINPENIDEYIGGSLEIINYTVEDDDIVIGLYGKGLKLEIDELTNSTLKIKKNNPIETENGIDYTISTYKKI